MLVRVVSLRGMIWNQIARRQSIYCGRKMPGLGESPLANPFKVSKRSTPEERQECLRKYEQWLDAHPERDRLLADLAEKVRQTGYPLSCWCGFYPDNPNLQCHAVILAKRVQKILEANP